MSSDHTDVDLGLRLDGKVALVTGGASGIGAAITSMFVGRGAKVAVLDLLTGREGQPGDTADGVVALACDVTDPASVSRATEAAAETLGPIDILVNCAGVVRLAPAEQLSLADWDITLDVNLKGTFLMCQAVGRMMLTRGHGRIINLASQAASVALEAHVAYCASKAGLLGLTRVLASEWGGRGVTVNTISPTVVLTDLGRAAWSGPKADAMLELIPVGRFALPEEIAAVALFLASGSAAMINGADIVVDGGFTIR